MPKKTKKEEKETKKSKKVTFYNAVGRRKESSCRVRLYVVSDAPVSIKEQDLKKGEILVNGKNISKYFSGSVNEKLYLEPFRTTNTLGRFAVSALVTGGGKTGQLGAFIHGVSRALLSVDEEKYRPILRKKGFLTRDPRSKERRKAGLAQSARAKKQSPKR